MSLAGAVGSIGFSAESKKLLSCAGAGYWEVAGINRPLYENIFVWRRQNGRRRIWSAPRGPLLRVPTSRLTLINSNPILNASNTRKHSTEHFNIHTFIDIFFVEWGERMNWKIPIFPLLRIAGMVPGMKVNGNGLIGHNRLMIIKL